MELIFSHHKNAHRVESYGHMSNNDVVVPFTPEQQELMEIWTGNARKLFVEFYSSDPDVEWLFFEPNTGEQIASSELTRMFQGWQRDMGIHEGLIIPPRQLRHLWVITAKGGRLPDDAPLPSVSGMARIMGHGKRQ